jgi:NADP-dependent 3-hydroxy acid dehydrogenase YdfG
MASSAELAGWRVVVAGASGGIGSAIAWRLAAGGAALTLVARRPEALARVAAETGGRALAGDVADRSFVERLRAVVEEDGPPDVVVHAAGAFALAPVAATDPDLFRGMLESNLVGPFLLMRAFLPAMLQAGRGDLVSIGSVAGRVAFPENGAYSASKFGLRGLHAVLEQELRGTGVRCTLVEPAATDTALWDPVDPDGRPDLPSRDQMLPAVAVADAVVFAITRPRDAGIPTVAVQRS